MVNYEYALSQSESGKYFEWIIIGFIFCPGRPLDNNNSALPFCDTYLTFEPMEPSREGGGALNLLWPWEGKQKFRGVRHSGKPCRGGRTGVNLYGSFEGLNKVWLRLKDGGNTSGFQPPPLPPPITIKKILLNVTWFQSFSSESATKHDAFPSSPIPLPAHIAPCSRTLHTLKRKRTLHRIPAEYCFHSCRALPCKLWLILRGKTHLSFHTVCCAPWCQSFLFSRDARNRCHHLRVESGVQEDDGADAFFLLALSNSCRQNSWTETNQIKQSGAYEDGFRTVDHRGTFP